MRDYAELVAGLRDCAKHTCCSAPAVTGVAADAIEELLAKNNELWTQLHAEGRSLISEPPKEETE